MLIACAFAAWVLSASPGIEVAITVDDLPAHGPLPKTHTRQKIVEEFVAVFKRHRVSGVYGFVNGSKLEADPTLETVLKVWVAAGHRVGNHTWSHINLHRHSVAEYMANVERNEPLLVQLQKGATSTRFFRYPFLFEGESLEKYDAVRSELRTRKYITAEVTIDADDWAYNAPFARCTDAGEVEASKQLRADFVAGHVDELRRMRRLTHQLEKREVAHVLLLHLGGADADALEDLLSAFEREGVRWISLSQALSDPLYAADRRLAIKRGPALPYVLAEKRGLAADKPVFARGLEERLDMMCRSGS